MADLNDYWFAAKQAFSERSIAAFGETIKAIERDRNSEDSRRESDLLKMNPNAPSTMVDWLSGETMSLAEKRDAEVRAAKWANSAQEYPPWKSESYIQREASAVGRKVNDVLDTIETAGSHIRTGSFKEDVWDRIDRAEKTAYRADINNEVDVPRYENPYKPTQSQQYKDEQAFYAKHDPVTQQQRDAAWAAAPSSGPSERRDEVVTSQMVMKL